MVLLTLALGMILVAHPALTCREAGRLRATNLVPLMTLSVAIGALAIELGLVLTALPELLGATHLAGLATVCEDAFGGLIVGNPVVGWFAATAAAWLAVRTVRALHRAARMASAVRAEPWFGRHSSRDGFDLVAVPTPEPLALHVPGRPPQVIVSEGLIESLAPAELELVIAHEAAHLALGHRRHLLVLAAVDAAFGRFPPAQASTARIRLLMEAAADDAAASCRGPRAVSRVITLVACATRSRRQTHARQTPVLERILRLQQPLARPTGAVRAFTLVPMMAFTLAVLMLVVGWFAESHHAVALGAYCLD